MGRIFIVNDYLQQNKEINSAPNDHFRHSILTRRNQKLKKQKWWCGQNFDLNPACMDAHSEMWTRWTEHGDKCKKKSVATKSTGMTCLFYGGSVGAFSFVDNAAHFDVIRFGVLVIIVAWHMNDDRTFLGVVYVRLVIRLRFSYMWLWRPSFVEVNVSTCLSSFGSLPLSFTCRSIRPYLTNILGIHLKFSTLLRMHKAIKKWPKEKVGYLKYSVRPWFLVHNEGQKRTLQSYRNTRLWAKLKLYSVYAFFLETATRIIIGCHDNKAVLTGNIASGCDTKRVSALLRGSAFAYFPMPRPMG